MEVFKDDLPEILEEEEIIRLFKEYKCGNINARNIIIEHNIRLVLDRVFNNFRNVNYDKEELVSIGLFGLVKAVDTYDLSKGYLFNTYAVNCIDNEIKMVLRRSKKNVDLLSLNYKYNDSDEADCVEFQDFIEDDNNVILNFMNNIENQEISLALKNIIASLSDEDKQLINMTFGFNGCKIYKQKEIAKAFHVARTSIIYRTNNLLRRIAKELYKSGYIDKPKMITKYRK